MTLLDELARSARADLAHAADARSRSRPDLDVLRRRGVMRHTTSVVALLLLVAVGAAGLIRLVAIGEVVVPVIGEIDPAPTDDAAPPPAAEPLTLQFDSGESEPHRLVLTADAEGDVCYRFVGRAPGATMVVDSCVEGIPAGEFFGSRSLSYETNGGEVQTCELGQVHEDVATVELHFPEGPVKSVEVLSAREIGADAYYVTCWTGEPELAEQVLFDADGQELARRDPNEQ